MICGYHILMVFEALRAWFDSEVFNETSTIMYRIFKLPPIVA